MTPRRFVVALAAVVALACFATATAADLTPDTAYALVVRDVWSKNPLPKPEDLAAARKVLETQAAKEPAARWAYALGHVANAEAEQATGDARQNERKAAVERFEHAAELDPKNADYQFWFASACFDRVDDV